MLEKRGKMDIRICDICRQNGKMLELTTNNIRLIYSSAYGPSNGKKKFWDLCEMCRQQIEQILGDGSTFVQIHGRK